MSKTDYLILGFTVFFIWIIPSLFLIGYGFKLNKKMTWKIIATGLFTPWVVGSMIKIYLDSLGKITLPWSYFLKPQGLAVFVPASIWWGIPFLLIGLLSRQLIQKNFLGIRSERGKFYLLMGVLAGAFIGAGRIFVSVFWIFDAMVIIVPIWTFYIKDLLIGLLLGWLIGKRIDSINKKHKQSKTAED
jgi:hypothetical protein